MQHSDIPTILVVVGILLIVLAVAIVVRQLIVSRKAGGFECMLQRRTLTGTSWQSGLMRFGTDRLRWFRAFSLRLGPSVVIRRSEIVDVQRHHLDQCAPHEVGHCLTEFTMRDGHAIRVLVDSASGAAMGSWWEAAPTGGVRGDTD